jgi:hypothetical protein
LIVITPPDCRPVLGSTSKFCTCKSGYGARALAVVIADVLLVVAVPEGLYSKTELLKFVVTVI